MKALESAALLGRLAWRSVRLQRGKSLLVGGIFLFGAFFMVVGNALVDAMDVGMTRSITQSLAGHLQVYDADAKDKLAIYGDEFAGMPDFGIIPNFARMAEVIRKVPGVKAVLPMGSQIAMSSGGNELDRRLADLRAVVARGDAAAVAYRVEQIQRMIELLVDDLTLAQTLVDEGGDERVHLENARRALSPEFWAEFKAEPLPALEFLENKIAPLQAEGTYLGLWFVGTDLTAFAHEFSRFEVVLGQPVPEGERGFLFNHGFYEDAVKNPIARELDQLLRAAETGRTLATDPELRARLDRARKQYRRILFQLDPEQSTLLTGALQQYLGRTETDLALLVQAFLDLDDANLAARHAWFYQHIAPLIELYAVPVGGTLTVQSFTKAGYARALNLKVYGTFQFKGLERSTISKQHNLVDLMSFRDLYGDNTPERVAELAALRAAVGAQDVTAENAEDALFGDDAEVELPAKAPTSQPNGDPPNGDRPPAGDTPTSDPPPPGDPAPPAEAPAAEAPAARPADPLAGLDLAAARQAVRTSFTRAELEDGLALHAAVVLDDPSPANIAAKRQEIQAALDAAGQRIKVVDWQEASGMVGQLVVLVRVILGVVVIILAVVALVVINNSMVMATLERIKEVGTMRAIGAPRRFITRLFMTETLLLGFLAGGAGAAVGGGLVLFLKRTGIPSTNEFTAFMFSGAYLRPELSVGHVVSAVLTVVVVGVISTFYPARLAARVPPAQAMGAGDGT